MSDLTQTGAPEPADPARTVDSQPASADAPEDVPNPPGYALLGEIGQGGMGVVYRARDLELDREVAVKVLRGRYRAGSAAAARFLDEARITARLQHPGIPAVYRVGELPDARPFLAMKLIKGRTLDELLRAEGPGAARWLGAFESACHAVGYAHARGVIHRDPKPHNIMVGAFGEVQVMDWGLAKVLGDTAAPVSAPTESVAHSEVYLPRDSDCSLTQAGSVLGTPAFMPPEQTAGEVEKIDRRADVFGLGAILCALLTGKPPYEGTTAESVRLAAVRGNTADAFARLDASGADAAIVSLCKRCMAFEPTDRPADADAVATAIADLRRATDERLRQAERDRLAVEVRAAEQAKRQRALLWSALAVVAVLAVGVAASLLQAKRARDAEAATAEQLSKTRAAEKAVTDQLAKTKLAEEAARTKSEEMDATLKLIDQVYVRSGKEAEAIELYKRLVAIREQAVEVDPNSEVDRSNLVRLLDQIANQYDSQGKAELADVEYKRAVKEAEALVSLANGDQYQETLCGTLSSYAHFKLSRDPVTALEYFRRSAELERRFHKQFPKDKWRCRQLLGRELRICNCLLRLGRVDSAREHASSLLALAKECIALEPEYESLSDVYLQLANCTLDSDWWRDNCSGFFVLPAPLRTQSVVSQLQKAMTFLDSALEDSKRAVAAGGGINNEVDVRDRMALISELLGEFSTALGHRRAIVDVFRGRYEKDRSDYYRVWLIDSLKNVGRVLEHAGDFNAAIGSYEEAIRVAKSIVKPDQFGTDTESLQLLITGCRAKLAAKNPDIVAPAPRIKREN